MDDIIVAYTRAQAIEDGVLIGISKKTVFDSLWPSPQAAWADTIVVRDGDLCRDETCRTLNVLTCLRHAAKRAAGAREIQFDVLLSKGVQELNSSDSRPIAVRAIRGSR